MIIDKTCILCQRSFVSRQDTQKKCETCLGEQRQKKQHQITVDRRCLGSWICKNMLPRERFEVFTLPYKGSLSSLKATFKGSEFGASWRGRIDIYVNGEKGKRNEFGFLEFPEYVRVRYMEVTKQSGIISEPNCNLGQEDTLEYSSTNYYLSLDYLYPDEVEGLEEIELDQQIVYVKAYTKTTNKGLGRQFWAKLEGNPIYAWYMRGGARGGRFGTEAAIAIVNKNNPIVSKTWGDIEEYKSYPEGFQEML